MKKSKWETLAEIDRRFGRRSAELHAARVAHDSGRTDTRASVATHSTAPENSAPSLWLGVALFAIAAACAVAFSVVAQ